MLRLVLRPLTAALARRSAARLGIAVLLLGIALPVAAASTRVGPNARLGARQAAAKPIRWEAAVFWGLVCQLGPAGVCPEKLVPLGELGCVPGPDGVCLPQTGTQSEAGCEADPSGRCTPR